MPDKTPCRHCKKTGFVRRERVIRGGVSATEYYCGACEHSWTITDDQPKGKRQPARRAATRPDRSRS
jgi:hypothetical protein